MLHAHALFIEAGHGKSSTGTLDPGATLTVRGQLITERSITTDVAGRTFRFLKSKQTPRGKTLIQDVGVSTSASVSKKMEYVNNVITLNQFDAAKCFGVAVHVNSASSRASGIMAYYQDHLAESKELADYVCQAVQKYLQFGLRSPYLLASSASRFGGLYIDQAVCPYIVLELGFLQNAAERSVLQTQGDRIAEAISHGILNYLRAKGTN